MCGIVGVAGFLGKKEKDVFRDMLVFDSVRGEHSTGILGVNNKMECLLSKSVGDPYALFDRKQTDKTLSHATTVLLGHNRFATTGGITHQNAHPFEFDTIVGAHNGTLRNAWALPHGKEYAVDSQRLFANIEEDGLADAIGLTLGAWTLVWYDKINDSINFLRNEERPLSYCFAENGTDLFWASEGWMLGAALGRNGIKHTEIKTVPIDTHMECFLDGFKGVREVVTTVVKGKVLPPIETYVPNSDDYYWTPPHKKKLECVDGDFVEAPPQKFQILTEGTDKHGAKYLELKHPKGNSTIVRLYLKQDTMHLWGSVQQSVMAKVTSVKASPEGIIYKCSLAEIPAIVEDDVFFISKKDHDLYYDTCAWCATPLEFGDKDIHYGTCEFGAVCGSCKNLEEVKPYLK